MPLKLEVPSHFKRGMFSGRRLVETGRTIIDYYLEAAGLESLAGLDVLDYGCGHRMAQVLAEYDLDIGSYTGLDLEPDLIAYLQEHCTDPRLQFATVPFANALYRPLGEPMSAASALPVDDRQFDAVWLLSVFTHLDPDDAQALLHILRRYVRADGTIFLSAFVNPLLPTPFVDVDPDQPLRRAVFSEEHLFTMLERAGWQATFYSQPREIIQTHLLCRPTDDPHPPRPPLVRTEHGRRYAAAVRDRPADPT